MKKFRLPWYLHPNKDVDWLKKERKRLRTFSAFAREILISYNLSMEGIVFKEFREDLHVIEAFTPNPHLPVIRYFDYGRVNATLFSQMDKYGRLVFFHEIVLEKSGTYEQAQACVAYSNTLKCAGFKDYDDPAGSYKDHRSGTTDVEILERFGIFPSHFVSGQDGQRRINRIELTKMKLSEFIDGQPIISVTQGCATTILAFQVGYRYKTNPKNDKIQDNLEEEHPFEDVMDCLCGTVLETLSPKQTVTVPRHNPALLRRNKYTG
jgi:hypothetical protein